MPSSSAAMHNTVTDQAHLLKMGFQGRGHTAPLCLKQAPVKSTRAALRLELPRLITRDRSLISARRR